MVREDKRPLWWATTCGGGKRKLCTEAFSLADAYGTHTAVVFVVYVRLMRAGRSTFELGLRNSFISVQVTQAGFAVVIFKKKSVKLILIWLSMK